MTTRLFRSPAVKILSTGLVVEGIIHAVVYDKLGKEGLLEPICTAAEYNEYYEGDGHLDWPSIETFAVPGFTTQDGSFLSREEASRLLGYEVHSGDYNL